MYLSDGISPSIGRWRLEKPREVPKFEVHSSILPLIFNSVLALLFLGLIASGAKHFTMWSQITDILTLCGIDPVDQFGRDPFELFRMHHPHALRYLVVWPLVEFSIVTGVDVSTVFSYVVLPTLLLTSWILSKTLQLADRSAQTGGIARWYMTQFLMMGVFISLFMNGRLVMVYLGISIILYAQVHFLIFQEKKYRLLLLLLTGLLLTSLSSGTFTIAFCVIMAFLMSLPLMYLPMHKFVHMDIILCGIIVATLSTPFLSHYVTKNLSFFSYSLARMLMHGPPKFLYDQGVDIVTLQALFSVVAILSFFTMMFGYFLCLWSKVPLCPLILLVGFSLCIGIFGYSELLAMVPAIELMVVYMAARLKKAPGLTQFSGGNRTLGRGVSRLARV